MRTQLFSMLALLVSAATLWADKPATGTAEDVIKAAIKATGGQELLSKYNGGTMKMKGEVSEMGINVEIEGKVTYMMPDRIRMTMTGAVMGQKFTMEQVMNGKKMKMTLNGADLPIDDNVKAQLASSAAEHEITQLVALIDAKKKYTIKLGDDADVDGKKADVVIVSNEELKVKDVKLFFDKKSHLLVKSQKKDTDSTGGDVNEESFYSDYKEIQGIQTPHKFTIKHDGKDHMTFTVSDVKYMEKIDEKEFPVDD